MEKKIAIVIGTKAELIKCMPIMRELQDQKKNYIFIHTGQHPLGQACEDFGVEKPDYILSEEPKISTKFWSIINHNSFIWNISMVFKIRGLIRKISPDYVIYHGDTMSTADAAIGSSKIFNLFGKKWKNVHLEAGLRSGSLLEPFPEEISRTICTLFSDILLAVSDLTEKNLKKYKRKNIIKTGNSIIDSFDFIRKIADKRNDFKEKDFVLINIHRHEHLRSKKLMKDIVEIINSVSAKGIWPMHDNTEYHLKKYGLMGKVRSMKNIKIIPLVNYYTFIKYMENCKYIITDGGSIQEESLIIRKPCVILRRKTERQEGLKSGYNFLTKIKVAESKRIISDIESGKIKATNYPNPYGMSGVSKRIVEVLR